MSSLQITFLQIVHPTKDTCKMLTICILKNYNIRETVAAAPRWGPGGRGGPHTWWWADGLRVRLVGLSCYSGAVDGCPVVFHGDWDPASFVAFFVHFFG